MAWRMTLQHLKEITNLFSPERELGRGGFGVVYKGILHNGVPIAVKRLVVMPGIQDKQFKNEVDLLTGLKHPNIVQLIGYCDERQDKLIYDEYQQKHICAEMQEKLLCYEYLPMGSLDNIIFDESCGVDWHDRYTIIEGICHGLCYLHEGWNNTPIIHLDLKPSNILLDDNMMPKIADFGLSRLFGEEQTRTSTTMVIGSIGYMAPEYWKAGEISIKSDIYSLGILILEIVTGQKNHRSRSDMSGQRFIENVRNNWKGMMQIASRYPSLVGDSLLYVNKCIEIGLNCVDPDPKRRPTATKIVNMLPGQCKNAGPKPTIRPSGISNGSYNNPVVGSMARNGNIMQVNQMDHNLTDLLRVEPLELRFPCKITKQFSCSVLLTNKTDHYIAYKVKVTRLNTYSLRPSKGVLTPRSMCNIIVTTQAQQGASSNMANMDKILVESTILGFGHTGIVESTVTGLKKSHIGRDISQKELGNLVDAALKGNDNTISKIYVNILNTDAFDINCANKVAQRASSAIKGTDQRKQSDATRLNNSPFAFSTIRGSSVDLNATDGMQISVRIPSISKTIKLNVMKSSTVADVKEDIERYEGILLDDQILMYAGQQLENKQMLSECGLRNGQTLHVLVCPTDKLCIFINIRDTRTVSLDVKSWYTVADVKLMIETMFGFPSCTQILKRTQSGDGDVELTDIQTLKDQYIKSNDVLMLHPNVQIFINTWEGRTLTILASMLDTEVEIRSKINEKSHISGHAHYLCYRGCVLSPGITLEMYKVESNSTITIRARNAGHVKHQDDKKILSEHGLNNCQAFHDPVCPASDLCIFINIGDTRTTKLDVKSCYTVADVKLMIERLFGFPSSTQIIMLTRTGDSDVKLTDTQTLKDQHIKNNDVLMLHPNIQVFVKTWEGRTLTILASMLDTEVEIRSKIKEKSQIMGDVHYLCYRGRILSSGLTLEMYKVESNSTITIRTRNAGYAKRQEEI